MVPVSDLPTAVAFYRDTLGMMLLWNETHQGHAAFDSSAGPLVLRAMGEGKRPETQPPLDGSLPQNVVVAFEVSDIQTCYSTFKERGVQFLEEIEDHPGRLTAKFLDPFGNVLEINQSKQ